MDIEYCILKTAIHMHTYIDLYFTCWELGIVFSTYKQISIKQLYKLLILPARQLKLQLPPRWHLCHLCHCSHSLSAVMIQLNHIEDNPSL